MDKRGGGEYQDFPSKIFCLTVPKNFVGEHFSVSLISGIGKFYASEGYVTIFDFLSKFFCLTVPKNLVGGILQCFINFRHRKSLDKRWGGGGVSRFSVGNFLSHSAENFRRGGSFSVSLISDIEKVWIRGEGGSIKIFRRIFFCLTVPKNFRWGGGGVL